ncbi:serine/threonine protein kinase KNS1, partial [Ascoidea rubescens DSM 1968]
INSSFANNRFTLKKLLGQGTYGKVVSAIDNHNNNKIIAIKIIKSIKKYREASKIELRILSTIKKFDPESYYNCILIKEFIDYKNHICIITDLLSISLFDFLEKNNFRKFPGSHIQSFSKQILTSICFLHDLNIIHTDLKPENILLINSDYISNKFPKNLSVLNNTSNLIYKNYFNSISKQTSLESKILIDTSINIIDFGSAIFNDEFHSSIVSTRHYRAPEIIFGIGWSYDCDLWSIGCILAELVVGEAIFKTHDNIEHLLMMEKITNKRIDLNLISKCCLTQDLKQKRIKRTPYKNYSKHFLSDDDELMDESDRVKRKPSFKKKYSLENGRRFIKQKFPRDYPKTSKGFVNSISRIDILVSSSIGININSDLPLEESFINFDNKNKPVDKDTFTFWYFFIDLLIKLLTIEPHKRISAWEALNHPWFQLGIYDEGTSNASNH